MTKYIFVTGGVVSSLGKGIFTASIASVIKKSGYKVRIKKCDPYINIDCGKMNPYQHGEVYISSFDTEVDADFGHYERMNGEICKKGDSITTGQIYDTVIKKERNGKYLGNTVQIIPHITDEIKKRIFANDDSDFIIVEIGGTVGDIEGLPFVEAARQIGKEEKDVIYIHLTYMPYLDNAGEFKTKPTQHSVRTLQSLGIDCDILVVRSSFEISEEHEKKLIQFCGVKNILNVPNVENIYSIPILINKTKFLSILKKKFNLKLKKPDLSIFKKYVDVLSKKTKYKIGIIGKYFGNSDLYLSIQEALRHAAVYKNTNIEIVYINTKDIKKEINYDGFIIPGGFGSKGTKEIIDVIKFCREKNIPLLGICLGMQLMIIEFAQNVIMLKNSGSKEFGSFEHYLIDYIDNKKNKIKNNMNLGSKKVEIIKSTILKYKEKNFIERFRNKLIFNYKYKDIFEKENFKVVATSEKHPAIIELQNKKFFIGVQFHPEFNSNLEKAHTIFTTFIESLID